MGDFSNFPQFSSRMDTPTTKRNPPAPPLFGRVTKLVDSRLDRKSAARSPLPAGAHRVLREGVGGEVPCPTERHPRKYPLAAAWTQIPSHTDLSILYNQVMEIATQIVSVDITKLLNHLTSLCKEHYGERLVSLAVFGSVGRGTPRPDSDIDLLLVVKDLPVGRIARVKEFAAIETTLGLTIKGRRCAYRRWR